jgi:glycosidase
MIFYLWGQSLTNMNKTILACLLLACLSCVTDRESINNMTENPTDKLVVYQLFTRYFGNTNTTNKPNGTIAENGSGKFNDISSKALSELKKFGSTHIWFTGVVEHATMTDFSKFGIPQDNPQVIKGIAGSPYAIKDYYDVNPALAVDVNNRMREFEELVKRTHDAGLKVIIDFVPNHVAREYRSDVKPEGIIDFGADDDNTKPFAASNNFYYLNGAPFTVPAEANPPVKPVNSYTEKPARATGNDVFTPNPTINDWYETIKLNYGVDYANNRQTHFEAIPDTWNKMYDILSYWQAKGVDGFRCDMAEMVPVAFWGWVIPKLKQQGEAVFIAEIYNPAEYGNYIYNGKFDYLYDKVGLYDAVRRLMEDGGSVEDITKVWQKESGEFSNRMLRFLENHDEQRIASRFFAKNMNRGKAAMALSATLHGGPLMYYYGQEVGVNPTKSEGFQGEDGRTTIFDYWGVPEFQAWVNGGKFDGGKLSPKQKKLREFYVKLNEFISSSDIVKNGKFWDLQYANVQGQSSSYDKHKIYSYVRYLDKERLLFVYNFDYKDKHIVDLRMPDDLFSQLNIDGQQLTFTEVLTGELRINMQSKALTSTRPDVLGMSLTIEPGSFKVFKF